MVDPALRRRIDDREAVANIDRELLMVTMERWLSNDDRMRIALKDRNGSRERWLEEVHFDE